MSVSIALVALQMIALAAVAWPWHAARFHALGWALLALAALLGGWVLAHNRPGNFSVLPEPRQSARLVTTGPYARVRHPMYAAVLVGALGFAVGWNTWVHWLAWLALAVVLAAKARREERLLMLRFPGYADYAGRTPRFVPHFGGRNAR